MPIKRGDQKHPRSGRPPGQPNKATARGREAIAQFVDDNASRLVGWLDQIAEEDPEAAFRSFMSVVEYHIPKLARSELTGKDGGELSLEVLVMKALDPSHGQSH